ncbi:hypothetical protein BJ170DRAFT_382437 [Xylariales sp. AK1849]|nr:hypothetical protein BJ170DRAFT_382437 [Xylariales sp. AK1849]
MMHQIKPYINEHHALGPDIYEPLFDNVFSGDVYNCWQLDSNSWQLRIVGGPASGKSVLAATIARKLREEYDGEKEAVASIFVGPDVEWNEIARDGVLRSIFRQMNEKYLEPIPSDRSELQDTPDILQEKGGKTTHASINEIHQGLEERVGHLERAFLVVDGTDRCGWFSDICLEKDIEKLERLGLKVVLTSRTLARSDDEWNMVTCDNCSDPQSLQVFWECKSGKHDEPYNLCISCYDADKCCPDRDCQSMGSFIQPYTRCRVEMSEAVAGTLQNFISWDLENEHGDLGLGSQSDTKPPLSMFGNDLRNSTRPRAASWLQEEIRVQADNNVALARLRTDLVLDNTVAIQDANALSGELPRTIVTFFDAAIESVRLQAKSLSNLGLRALVIWSDGVDTVDALLSCLANISFEGKCYSLGEVLHAAQGLLVAGQDDRKPINPFTFSFSTYLTGGYCSQIDEVKMELQSAEAHP